MPLNLSPPPILFDESLEHVEPDEAETTEQLIETLTKINQTTLEHEKHAHRSVHAKSHALLTGELIVPDDLPRELAQGIFAKPGRYPLVMRLSTVPGDILDDSVSTPRGMAVKIVGVEGERLPGSDGDVTQDFVLVNGPAFSAPNAKRFAGTLKLIAATTDRAEGAKKALSAVLRGTERVIEAFGGRSPTLLALGGQPETNPLGDTYYSQAPLRFGDYVVKVSIAPHSPNLTALTDATLNVNGKSNGLREAMVNHFAEEGGEWDLRVQFCTDPETMPVEDASVVWPEEKSPYIDVARIVVPPQAAWNAARRAAIDDGLAFSPWHGIAAHRPLGSVMRARRLAYKVMAKFRAHHNNVSVVEPRSIEELGL
ncbi:Catalase [Luteibacter sp. UNC138MFCol5.1]|uniref:catalase family protein n=1 Tax=Luteibacter sp. UNC138MFCol5.1 TaxID=1502774 RepID=UPI0008C1E672|nr:catalase family protein [Luteibacter sp. UNC138MFCol5.1]SEO82818.1 Catalase [Luteibacter sp. UNC138MFCol5.1]